MKFYLLKTVLFGLCLISCKGKNEEKKDTLYPDYVKEASEVQSEEANPSVTLGKEIFNGKGMCFSCHKTDQKVIGPSVVEIARIYKEKNGDMVAFLKEKAEPIVDPSQYAVMKTNILLTKTYTDEELKALEDYFYSQLK